MICTSTQRIASTGEKQILDQKIAASLGGNKSPETSLKKINKTPLIQQTGVLDVFSTG